MGNWLKVGFSKERPYIVKVHIDSSKCKKKKKEVI